MEKTRSMRFLSLLLCAVMILGLMPISAFAAASFTQSQLSVVVDKQSRLADGVAQDLYTVYDKDGKQVKMFVATVDPTVETVKIFTSYKDMDNSSYGMTKLTEQVAAFNEKAAAGDEYYNGTVVVGINASYYNMTTGKPSGVFVMNGNDVTGGERSAYFAVMKDGSVKIGNSGEYEADKGNIQEAIGIYKMLVYGGNIVLSANDQASTQKYPRQTIGITADGKVILLSADGNNEPTSAGLTLLEQAQVMLDLGCVYAGHLDGGGSMTYGCKPEGEDSFRIINTPSDGSERSISSGLIIASTAAPSNVFDHVAMTAADEYVTPGTSTAITVAGVSSAGTSAEIPADITYSVTNGTYENGVLTASAEGDVVLSAMHNGSEVGNVTVHAVIPEKLEFKSTEITVPFNTTVALAVTATYGLNEVKIKASDISFALENDAIGTIDGFDFTAGDGSVTDSNITATVVGTDVTATAVIKLGMGSEVIFDFEDGDTSMFELGYGKYNYVLPEGKVYPVTAETGKVHSGNGAMALDINYGNSLESGYMMTALHYMGEEKKFENATKLGMWIYISDEDVSTWIRYVVYPLVLNDAGEYVRASDSITNTLSDGVAATTGFVNQYQEPGWHYLSIDLSSYKGLDLIDYYMVQFYISDRDGTAYGYYYDQHKSYNGRYVMYVDDITVDYSDAVEDREAPVFSSVTYATGSMSDAVALNGQTVADSTISFGAKVADNMKKNNYTGLDSTTAKAYIDGVETACTFKDGVFSIVDAVLADGLHHVKFSICDNQGNYASVIRTINVQANSGKSTVKVVAHDPSLDKILLGSVWYADIVATDMEKVQSVTVDIDLNNMSHWELDHMIVASGFEATYSIQDDENIATITVTRTGSNADTGEGVLASLPIRTWELKMGYVYESGTKKGSTAYTYAQFKSMKEFWPIDISMEIDRGLVTFLDGTTDTFSGEGPQVDTEMYKMAKDMISTAEGQAYYNAWNGGHIHTATAIEDKDAACTEAGYTDRTFCEVCSSVVNWGTTIPATGHSYEITDGRFVCTSCGDIYVRSGLFTMNGKTYYAVDGELIRNKWVQADDGAWYCMRNDYTPYTGDFAISGRVYHFGETGAITKGQWFYVNEKGQGTDKEGAAYLRYYVGPQYYYSVYGLKLQEIDGKMYGFNKYGDICKGYIYCKQYASDQKALYLFDENGVQQEISNEPQIITLDGALRYIVGGVLCANNGLVKVDGDYYYVHGSGAVETGVIYISAGKTNGLLPAGTYTFGADGKLQLKNGVIDGRYYIDGVMQVNLGLIKVGNDYYYIHGNGAVETGTFYVNAGKANGLLPAGTYIFGADGKLQLKNGFIDGRYYIDGVMQANLGLIKVDGDYYYIHGNGAVQVGTFYVNAGKTNGLLPAGTYTFDADGKLQIKDGFVDGRYYIDGVMQVNLGLIKVGEDYYYIHGNGAVQVGTFYVNEGKTNGLLPAGTYNFGADGKLIFDNN